MNAATHIDCCRNIHIAGGYQVNDFSENRSTRNSGTREDLGTANQTISQLETGVHGVQSHYS